MAPVNKTGAAPAIRLPAVIAVAGVIAIGRLAIAWPRLFDDNCSPVEFRFIEIVDGVQGGFIIIHFNKPVAFGPAGFIIHDYF